MCKGWGRGRLVERGTGRCVEEKRGQGVREGVQCPGPPYEGVHSQEGLDGAVGPQRLRQLLDATGAGHDAQVKVELRQGRGPGQGPADAAEVAVAEAAAA